MVCAGICESKARVRLGDSVRTGRCCVCIQFSPDTELHWLQNWSTRSRNVSLVYHCH